MAKGAEGEGGTAADAIRRYAPMIYGPTALYSLGQGGIVPLLPSFAAERGAGLAVAALVTAMLIVGQLCGNIPAGWLVARLGERLTMSLASVVSLCGVAGMLFAWHIAVLGASVFLVGLCAAAFALARHSFMTTRVPIAHRARSLSLLGGSFRLGTFVGPFVAAGLLALFGDEHAVLWFFGACLIGVGLLVTFGPDPESRVAAAARSGAGGDGEDTGEAVTGPLPVAERPGVFSTMWRNRGVLSRLGLAASSLAAVRAGRQTILPLWGVSIGLDSQTISLVIGVAGAIDFALFYASGQVMDRFGRLWAALPAMLLMGSGFIALAISHVGEAAPMWFGVFAAVIAVGNGLSSGILLTLGSDVAPAQDPAAFLGSWRTLTDGGAASTPLLVSAVTAALSLPIATAVVGVLGLLGALGFLRWVPRFVPRQRQDPG